MGRITEEPAPGFYPLRIHIGWVLIREETDQDGSLAALTPAVYPSGRPYIWRGRTGRRDAVRASWGLMRDEEIAATRAENERLRLQIELYQQQYQHLGPSLAAASS